MFTVAQRLGALTLAGACLLTGVAFGQDGGINPVLSNRFRLVLGAYFENVNSAAAKFREGGEQQIDFEQFGLEDDKVSPYIAGMWRMTDRFILEGAYYGTRREGDVKSSFDLEFGDLVIPVGTRTQSKFNVDLFLVDVGYSFVKNDRAELGAWLGAHIADLEVGVSKDVSIGDGDINFVTESIATTAPLPNIGLYGTYAFSPRWSISGKAGVFSLKYDKYDGDIKFLAGNVEYQAFKNVGIGLGYNYLDFDLQIEEDSFNERYILEYNGPLLYLSAGF